MLPTLFLKSLMTLADYLDLWEKNPEGDLERYIITVLRDGRAYGGAVIHRRKVYYPVFDRENEPFLDVFELDYPYMEASKVIPREQYSE
jgi:hypothetical protein